MSFSSSPPAAACVCLDLPDMAAAERIATGDLPHGMRGGPSETEFFRDVFYDSEDGDLERRGVAAAIRTHADGRRLLLVETDAAALPDAHARRLEAEVVGDVAPSAALSGSSEAARLVQALVDPSVLVPRLEIAAARWVRRVHHADPLAAPLLFLVSETKARAGGRSAELFELQVQSADGQAVADDVGEALHREFGAVPASASTLARAREALAAVELEALEQATRSSRAVAVVVFRQGRIALRREDAWLRVPSGPGTGEPACRRILRGCFADITGRVRLLGTAPGSSHRPAIEVWLAEGIEGDPAEGCSTEIAWIPLGEVLSSVGSPALRHAPTLAALHIAARSGLPLVPPPAAEEVPDAGQVAARHTLRSIPSVTVSDDEDESDEDVLPPGTLLNMELSVLAFNRRVLALAEDERMPLLERIRFLSIFGANLDEFFRVRVAGFKRQISIGSGKRTIDGVTAEEQLDAIGIRARQLLDRAYALLNGVLLPELERHGVRLLVPNELDEGDREYLRTYFREEVFPLLTPLTAGPGNPFPHIRNLRPVLAGVVRDRRFGAEHTGLVELPGALDRFVPLPDGLRFVALEEIVRDNMGDLYPGMEVDTAHALRVIRSAELHLDRSRITDLLQAVEEEVRRRPFRPVMRVEVEAAMPAEMREWLLTELQYEAGAKVSTLREEDVYVVERLIDLRALRELASVPIAALRFADSPPPAVPVDGRPLFEVLREGEVLVRFPEDSFESTVERFVVEAAEDPEVVSIKLALYRTNKSSRIVEAMRRASASGKQVVALVELTARFDEERNIEWARYLRTAGIHVIHGLPGLKIHAKIALVVRREVDGVRRYMYVGTGNLNATTAAAYTDLGLLSADPALGEDLNNLFNALTGYSVEPRFHRLLVAPHNMRSRFLELIEREAEHAREGRGGRITAKFNGLADREMIAALYGASKAGVQIELIVRGLCSLRPGVTGISENIRVISILGRYLEHARIFRFNNGGEPEYFIGSADWRTRNLSKRVEVAVPILDPRYRARLDELLERQIDDPEAWELGSDGTYYRRPDVAPHAPPRPAGQDGRVAIITSNG